MTADTAVDPKKTATYRALLAVVIILGVLIVLAFGALVVGSIMTMKGHRSVPVAGGPDPTSQLPRGARITSVQTSGDRIVIGVHTAQGDEVDIFDTETGKPVARIRSAAQ